MGPARQQRLASCLPSTFDSTLVQFVLLISSAILYSWGFEFDYLSRLPRLASHRQPFRLAYPPIRRLYKGAFGFGAKYSRTFHPNFADVWLSDLWSGAAFNGNISIRCRTSLLQKIGRTEPLRFGLAPASLSRLCA
jgi:hypothetical protein